MSAIDGYLSELAAAMRTRGRSRRRVLDECRAHLDDLARESGSTATAVE